jgi:hypothetical protein
MGKSVTDDKSTCRLCGCELAQDETGTLRLRYRSVVRCQYDCGYEWPGVVPFSGGEYLPIDSDT